MEKITLGNVDREYIVTFMRIASAKHNGADLVRVAEFYPEGSLVQVGEAWRFVRGNKVVCTCCSDGQMEEWELEDTGCVHSAIVKTWKRQGMPDGRIYVSFGNRIGYYGKKGKLVTLSTVEQVNRIGEEK